MTQPGTTPDDRKASAGGAARAVTAEAGSAVPTTHAAKRRAKAEGTPKPTGPRRTNGSTTSAAKIVEPDLAALRTQLVATVREHYPQADLAPVEQAFDLAVEAHQDQRRATGEPYVTHPIA
ncbi:MAG TPA: hypothetical protein VID95_07045, partial [Candidatus Limnocylindrales bacterium]